MQEKYALELINKGMRVDGRKLLEFREIELKTNVINKAEGSAYVKMGETQVIVGVKMNMGTPYADSMGEGVLMCGAEFTPMSSPDFESGPPSPESIELARVVDRGIRESHCIDVGKLVIDEKNVWVVNVDIHIINHDGNLMDASALGAIAALKTTKIPRVDLEKMEIVRNDYVADLPVVHTPINVSVCKVGSNVVLDPTKLEEGSIDSRISISVREDDKICALQKQGSKGIMIGEIPGMMELAMEKSRELRKLLE
ncbi:MAG: exosome complex protein Rrp42 [Candidatus Aenigmarchaeota archaeon]|nr:exosome complex protein Rrp42 [Candidatus Aenigmarchaeota archaeon]